MIACIDIGGTAIKVGVLDSEGNVYSKGSLKVKYKLEEFLDSLVKWIDGMKSIYKIEGISISSPGAVDPKCGTVGGSSAIACIHGFSWKSVLGEKVGLPISIENDANCAALAEAFNGSGKDVQDMMLIVCGTGIGGAIVNNGKVHSGKHLHGGEFGYMLMEEDDGEFRNFSEVASTMSLVRKVRRHYNDESFDGIKVFDECEKGSKFCIEAVDRFYLNLAKGIFNLQYIYDPEIILLGGAICERKDFIDKINRKLDFLMEKINIAKIRPNISVCMHKSNANLIGARVNFKNEYGF